MAACNQNAGRSSIKERAEAMARGTHGASITPRNEALNWDKINAENSANGFTPEMAEAQTARSSRMCFLGGAA